MNARKFTCLLLAAVFALATFVPALAGDTPPPGHDDHNIHPWDNSDGFGARGGHTEVYSRPIVIVLFGHLEPIYLVYARPSSRTTVESATGTRTPERTTLQAMTTRDARR